MSKRERAGWQGERGIEAETVYSFDRLAKLTDCVQTYCLRKEREGARGGGQPYKADCLASTTKAKRRSLTFSSLLPSFSSYLSVCLIAEIARCQLVHLSYKYTYINT